MVSFPRACTASHGNGVAYGILQTCTRCRNANIACLGYKDETDIVFRYHAPPQRVSPAEVHAARFPRTDLSDLKDDQPEDPDIKAFLDDFTVRSTDRTISRGFLDGLDGLIAAAGPSSDLALAMRIISLARTKQTLSAAHTLYNGLLQSLRAQLTASSHLSIRSLILIVLLGIYELIVCSDTDSGYCSVHVKGITAILSSANPPLNLRAATELFQMSDPLILRKPLEPSESPGVLCAPVSNHSVVSLDRILIKVHPLWSRSLALFADPSASVSSLRELEIEAEELDLYFTSWSESQPNTWLPSRIGFFESIQAAKSAVPVCPGPVDAYFDLYVAAVWNTYRKTHLMILDIVVTCEQRLGERLPAQEQRTAGYASQAEALAEGIAASIPFHLTSNLAGHMHASPMEIGRPIGGLLLLHPLNVLVNSTSISQEMRDYAGRCLKWIGENMGIGQASVLAKVRQSF